MDADKAVGVMFSYDGKLDSKLDAHFQCALLYTTARGERRVRCTNTVASVSEGASMDSMRYIDQDAVVSMIAREGNAPVPSDVNEADRGEATSRMTERTLKDIRNALTEKTVDILAGYRKTFSVGHPPGQLVLPENLKEFSMYMLSLIKSRALKGMDHHLCTEASLTSRSWLRTFRSACPRNAHDQVNVAHGTIPLPLSPNHFRS